MILMDETGDCCGSVTMRPREVTEEAARREILASRMVFPQDDPSGRQGLARAGGLTKREYFALHLLSALVGKSSIYTERSVENDIRYAVHLADELVNRLG